MTSVSKNVYIDKEVKKLMMKTLNFKLVIMLEY